MPDTPPPATPPVPALPSPASSASPTWGLWLRLAAPLLAAQAGLLALGDLARHLEAALVLSALAFTGLAWAARRLAETRHSQRSLTGGILAVGALLRLLALPLPPTLSNDIERYLWDGRVVAAGFNPYRLAPQAEELAPLRDESWRRLAHKEVATVYPPLALAVFTLAARLPASLWVLKALLAVVDLGAGWLLLRLAGRLGVPSWRAIGYLWNPLVVLEVAGMGHIDGLGVALCLGAVLAVVAGRPGLAGLATAGGALAKLAPLAALPAWARASRRPRLVAGVAGLVCLVTFAPLVASVGGLPPGLATYGVSWEFNGPLYEPLWRTLAAAGLDGQVKQGLDTLKEWGHHRHDEALNRVYPWVYPQSLAKLFLVVGMLLVVGASWRTPAPPAGASRRLFGGLLLCSATVYPWYLLWVLPWATLDGRRGWLVLSATSLLSYLPQWRSVPLWPWIYLGVWLPGLAAVALDRPPRPA